MISAKIPVTTFRRVALGLAAATAATAFVSGPALASGGGGGGGGTTAAGRCTTVSFWNMEAKSTGQGIQVRADVFSLPQTTWTWKMTDNGKKIAKGTALANRERHDIAFFEIRRTMADQQGTDAIRFVATQTQTGEVCDGSLTL